MVLSNTWFLDDYIDFELQKYKLLAYLQEVNQHFEATKLYPQLGDVIAHYRNLEDFQKNKLILQDSFPKELSKVDMEHLQLVYKKLQQDDDTLAEVNNIVTYAMDKIKVALEDGKDIYELVESQLCIEPVGIVPLYKKEGYLLLQYQKEKTVHAYNYVISLLQHSNANYTTIKLTYINSFEKSIATTYNNIKTQLIRNIKTLPNPAVYFMESAMSVPLNETLLPIAKRSLVRYIAAA